jgi:hypothetical protein
VVETERIDERLLFARMIISTNSQVASAGAVPISAGQQSKSSSRPSAVGQTVEENSDVALTRRNSSTVLTDIEDEDSAVASTDGARRHIVNNPFGSIAVQANLRPEVVFELLQGIL